MLIQVEKHWDHLKPSLISENPLYSHLLYLKLTVLLILLKYEQKCFLSNRSVYRVEVIFSLVITVWNLWTTVFYKSFVFQVMPSFKSRKSSKGLFSEQSLNKTLDDVLTNGISFRKGLKVNGIPIGTLHRYKKKMRVGNIEVKKLPSSHTLL